ncbi:SMP-30/gluconolactonase/LRE family protein [Tenggerimyces flavus]|uniref:SMP-30/gluconolactonase/LRE family protein n=1 Tax=Tenggerimyces flavus TaxID=1708749 RepID=A0ABV7YS91_9ACTN|nr:SMP-30/gluconolactonase/LRE family protein [Tenggerimyces flavus]MBM7790193.1 DNA-binding beta-propeller fold protein YncE [Tenggerimyces flavus]
MAQPAAAASRAAPPAVIDGSAPTLHPEGVAWDPSRKSFLVGSVRHGTVSIVKTDGSTRTLANEPRIVFTIGVHVDARRNRVLAAYADYGVGTRSTPETVQKQAGLAIFDLETGRTKHLVDLAMGPGPHVANDFAIDRAGNAYVTDSTSDKIYRVDTRGRASVLVQSPQLASPIGDGMNGIVWHPDGYLLAVRYDAGVLLRIPLSRPHRFEEVRLDWPLVGGGLVLRPDGSLLVVSNALGQRLDGAGSVLRTRDGWRSATTVGESAPWADAVPTTAAVSPYGTYVASGRLDLLVAGTPTDRFTLRRW